MNWFAWERSAGGTAFPTAYDERPDRSHFSSPNNKIIYESVRAIPPELRTASLKQLAEWARLTDSRA